MIIGWLMENGATLLVVLVLLAAVGLVIGSRIRRRKRGGTACGCGCGGCAMREVCHRKDMVK